MKKGCDILGGGESSLASLTDIITYIGQFGTWFWGIFSEFAAMVKETPILLYVIIASIVFTAISLLIKILKKMGFRGRRS